MLAFSISEESAAIHQEAHACLQSTLVVFVTNLHLIHLKYQIIVIIIIERIVLQHVHSNLQPHEAKFHVSYLSYKLGCPCLEIHDTVNLVSVSEMT